MFGGGHPDDYIGRFLDLGIIDGVDGNVFRSVVYDSFHGSSPLVAFLKTPSVREFAYEPIQRSGGGHGIFLADLSVLTA